jgi:5-methylcytosine-specific restriction protein A
MSSAQWTKNGPPTIRIRGRRLQRMRAALFARSPWCVLCIRRGLKTRATIRDHIIPVAEGGLDDESNEQALCLDCSDRKTEEEAARGVRRSEMTPRFRKSATPRDAGGQFSSRRRW